MNISCVICSDLFSPSAEIYITKCGHMFHFTCLINWIERSQTCPQCRCKSTEKTIHRVYFNLANTDGITDDVGTLMSKLENVQFQSSLKEKDLKILKEKYEKIQNQTTALREEVSVLESRLKHHESVMHAYKEQISFFKAKAKEKDRLSDELVKLKNSIKSMENVQLAINGTREQVNDMLRSENSIESLAILAATLKKTLLEAERRKRDMEHNLKKAQNESNKYRREMNTLECQNNDLRRELQHLKENVDKEKQYLKAKIADLSNKIVANNLDISTTALKRIATESPVNFSRVPQLTAPDDVNDTSSPTVAEKVKKIVESDSPYLSVKTGAPFTNYLAIREGKSKMHSITSKNKFSIFQPGTKMLETMRPSKADNNVVYNGLGGSSKEDVFPSPKPSQTGLKRQKSNSSLSSSKFKKLAPGPSKTRITSYISQPSSQ